MRYVAPSIALLGMHPALWEPATRIEVYPLAVFFALWAAARFVVAVLDEDQRPLPYFATGLGLGLAASANLICAFGVALAMTPRLVMGIARQEIPRRAIRMLIGGGLLGLAAHLYVFVVAGRTDVVVWGAPTSAQSILHYFTAADFASKGVESWSEWWTHVGELFFWSLEDGRLALLLAGFGGYALYARKRGLGRFFFNATWIFFVAFIARNGVFAPDVLDYNGYLAIPSWLAAAGVGLLVAYLGYYRASWAPVAIAALLLFVMVAPPRSVSTQPTPRHLHVGHRARSTSFGAAKRDPDRGTRPLGRSDVVSPGAARHSVGRDDLGPRPRFVRMVLGLSLPAPPGPRAVRAAWPGGPRCAGAPFSSRQPGSADPSCARGSGRSTRPTQLPKRMATRRSPTLRRHRARTGARAIRERRAC